MKKSLYQILSLFLFHLFGGILRDQAEILQTVRMTEIEHLDIRTVTLGLSLLDCAGGSVESTANRVREKIERTAAHLVRTVDEIGDEIGIRVANKRIATTPASLISGTSRSDWCGWPTPSTGQRPTGRRFSAAISVGAQMLDMRKASSLFKSEAYSEYRAPMMR